MIKQVGNSIDLISLLILIEADEGAIPKNMHRSKENFIQWLIGAAYNKKNYKIMLYMDEHGATLGYSIIAVYKYYDISKISILYVYVLPEYRGSGIGTKLIHNFMLIGSDCNAHKLEFTTGILSEEFIKTASQFMPLKEYRIYEIELTEEVRKLAKEVLKDENN